MKPVDSFGRTAEGLSRNPLGIIALFIVLVYGMAALVLSTAGTTFGASERWPMIWFLVLFPVLVLVVFAGLVVKFPKNLYSPSDYGNAGDFVRALSAYEQRARIEEEVKEELQEGTEEEPHEGAQEEPQKEAVVSLFAASSGRSVEVEHAGPRVDVQSEYLLAESLVLRELHARFGGEIFNHAAMVGESLSNQVQFDAIVRTSKRITGIEVKLFRSRVPSLRVLERVHAHASEAARVAASAFSGLEFKYILAVVADLPPAGEVELLSRVRKYFGDSPVSIELDFYRFADLKAKYGAARVGNA